MNDPHTARYNGNNPDEPPRETLGQPELPPPAPNMPLLPLLMSPGTIPLLLLRQQHADTARKQPRVNSRSIGAPPGTYDRRYHATAAACSAEKRRTRMYEWRTSAA